MWISSCGVEVWRGGVGGTYLLPTLSSVGASLAPPCFRFHTPLIEPDVRICRIRLSEKTHAIAEAIACDAICNFWKQLGSCQACRQSPRCGPPPFHGAPGNPTSGPLRRTSVKCRVQLVGRKIKKGPSASI